jgi:hypothetical protein
VVGEPASRGVREQIETEPKIGRGKWFVPKASRQILPALIRFQLLIDSCGFTQLSKRAMARSRRGEGNGP